MKTFFTFLLLVVCGWAVAQDDLLKELESDAESTTQLVLQTFKGSRIINGNSVETLGRGALEFIFSHRFGRLNSGSYTLWGLDDSYVRLGLEYGITDRLGVGIGRSSYDKTFDGFVRYKLLRQSTGSRSIPVSITIFGNTAIKTSPRASDSPNVSFEDRLAFVGSLMIARKFTSHFSMQLTPVFVHRNSVNQFEENNDDIALGVAGRYKITRSVAFSAEFYPRLNVLDNTPYFNSVGFGVDIETGGHVFQLVFTNSLGMIDRMLVAETAGDFAGGDIHFGFNITRNFQLANRGR
ncbi:MAG: DUF5777 family beta-barrel protein [Cyclobacteriaceae bacterium]